MINKAEILNKKTKPPALYTEAGILSAMENAGRQLENKEDQKILSNIGIGTPATRAAIIETLFARQYIAKQKKALIPTDKGLQVYELVKDKKIGNVAMTAEWETALQKIENSETDATEFHRQMTTYTWAITQELLNTRINNDNALQCPKCKNTHLLVWKKVVKCPDEHCGWMQFRTVCHVHLQTSDIEKLIKNGKTDLITGMKSKSGNVFDAFIVLGDDAKTYFDFPKAKFKKGKR